MFSLSQYGISVSKIYRNLSPAKLYELALGHEKGSAITDQGALTVSSGEKTGRSPKDRHIVESSPSKEDIWWGSINQPLDEKVFYD